MLYAVVGSLVPTLIIQILKILYSDLVEWRGFHHINQLAGGGASGRHEDHQKSVVIGVSES